LSSGFKNRNNDSYRYVKRRVGPIRQNSTLILAASESVDAIFRSVNTYPHLTARRCRGAPRLRRTPRREKPPAKCSTVSAEQLRELSERFEQRSAADAAAEGSRFELLRIGLADDDRQGFSAAAGQFDSDITSERHPRCALSVNEEELLAVCCDGRRSGVDAGLDMAELARLLVSFGAREAINLDGGGSATLVHRGHLLNRPYSDEDQPSPESRAIVTALVFDPA